MAKEKITITLPIPIANHIRAEAKSRGVSESEAISFVIDSYYRNIKLTDAILTTYREVRAARITADITAEKLYGEEKWPSYRDAIEDKVSDDIERLFSSFETPTAPAKRIQKR